MSVQLVMYRGDDRSWDFTMTEDDVAVDLTNKDIVFTCRAAIDDVTPTISLSSDAGDITKAADQPGAGKGMLTLTIPAADTVDLERNLTLLCDFELTDTLTGEKRTWPDAEYGQSTLIRLRVKGDVTHP